MKIWPKANENTKAFRCNVHYTKRRNDSIEKYVNIEHNNWGLLLYLNVTPFMTYTSNKILNNVSYSHKVDFLTTEKLAGFKMKSWQVFKQKVGRFYPKNRVPPPNSKIHSRPGRNRISNRILKSTAERIISRIES